MSADDRSDDRARAEPSPAADDLVARVLFEVRATRAAILQSFERQRRRGVDWRDDEPDNPADDAHGGAA
jgi:hypothetical protein